MTPENLENSPQITLRGISGNLTAVAYGNPQHPPLLALHGWLDNAASFAPLSAFLDSFYIVALDFAGHGHSDPRPSGCTYHMVDYVADVAHAVDDLGWNEFGLLGHSLGAGVAILYAALYPEQVNRLVMIDGVGPISGTTESAVERMRKAVNAGLLHRENQGRAAKIYPEWSKLVSARLLASPLLESSAHLLLHRGTTKVGEGARVNADPRLKHPSAVYLSEEVVTQFLGAVTSPALLILAEQGMVANRSFTASRIEAFDTLEVRHLQGKHHLHMDDPQPVAELIETFLRADGSGGH